MVLLASLGSSAPLMEVRSEKMVRGRGGERPLKADSHIASHAHAVPLPCRALIDTPCRAPALLRECRIFRESPRGSREHPNC